MLKPTNKMLETVPFEVVFYSLDWHPDNHVSFIENVGQRKLHSSSQVRHYLKSNFENGKVASIIRKRLMGLEGITQEIYPSTISLLTLILYILQKKAEEAVLYDTVVFEGPPLNEQKLWPKHCVQNSWGAELHSAVKVFCEFHAVITNSQLDCQIVSRYWITEYLSTKGFIRTSIPIQLFGITTRCQRHHWLLCCKKKKLLTCMFAD